MIRLAVFCSGGGTNFQALAEGLDKRLGEIVLCVLSKEGLYAEERAKKLGIPSVVIGKKQYADPERRFEAIGLALAEAGAEAILLAGYLTVLPASFLSRWKGKILNIHPAYLPRHGGVGCYGIRVHRAVIEAGEDYSGVSIHFVTETVDGGEILMREKYPVTKYDTPETVAAKGHVVEQYLYKHAVDLFLRRLGAMRDSESQSK